MTRWAYVLIVALFAALLLLVFPAHAGYAQLSPPPGFTSVGGVSTMPVGAAANGARYAGGHVIANASLNVGARSVTVPVAFRVAANAATFTATRLNPWIAGATLAVGAVGLISDWFSRDSAGPGLEVGPDGRVRVAGRSGGAIAPPNGDYWVVADGLVVLASSAAAAACPGNLSGIGQCTNGQTIGRMAYCTNGTTRCFLDASPSQVPSNPSAPPRDPVPSDVSTLGDVPVNPALLPELGLPIPVDPIPVINPSTQPVGDVLVGPNGNPAPQLQPSPEPLRYPDGDPVPIPNTNPQRYTQPWYEVTPSPAPGSPWRVDVRPITTETTSPTPQPDPVPNPNPNPNPNPVADFYTDCDKYPGSLGCMPVGEQPPTATIPTRTLDITQQTGPTFGGGGCPANLNFSLNGQQVTGINMATPCSWITSYVKPIILLLAAISAVFIVLPRAET